MSMWRLLFLKCMILDQKLQRMFNDSKIAQLNSERPLHQTAVLYEMVQIWGDLPCRHCRRQCKISLLYKIFSPTISTEVLSSLIYLCFSLCQTCWNLAHFLPTNVQMYWYLMLLNFVKLWVNNVASYTLSLCKIFVLKIRWCKKVGQMSCLKWQGSCSWVYNSK